MLFTFKLHLEQRREKANDVSWKKQLPAFCQEFYRRLFMVRGFVAAIQAKMVRASDGDGFPVHRKNAVVAVMPAIS
jgi:hypothetical protein